MDWDSLAAEGGNCCGCRSVLGASGMSLPVTVSTVRYDTVASRRCCYENVYVEADYGIQGHIAGIQGSLQSLSHSRCQNPQPVLKRSRGVSKASLLFHAAIVSNLSGLPVSTPHFDRWIARILPR